MFAGNTAFDTFYKTDKFHKLSSSEAASGAIVYPPGEFGLTEADGITLLTQRDGTTILTGKT